MAKGLSLHIGLNYVDPNAYGGWNGALAGCINDANSMEAIARQKGFTTHKLIDNQATSSQVVSKICEISQQLVAGDIFLLTYSGHGGQLPDQTGMEEDAMDETWVLWDRELLDNELYCLWSRFASGVRIFVSSDSCHSGTVVKMMFKKQMQQKSAKRVIDIAALKKVSNDRVNESLQILNANVQPGAPKPAPPKIKFIPIDVSLREFDKRKEEYRYYGFIAGPKDHNPVSAHLIYISGCQDNQYSYDGDQNGLFTSKLLQVWANGNYSGSHLSFYNQISALMPSYQTPNYLTLGMPIEGFINQKPYSVESPAGASTGVVTPTPVTTTPTAPQITPPTSWARDNGTPPTFQIAKGSNQYYYVEFAASPELLRYNASGRMPNNFFASWDQNSGVSPRLTDTAFQLPVQAWNNLKNNQMIYCKIGSTSSSDPGQWENYMVTPAYEEEINENMLHMQIVAAAIDQPVPEPQPQPEPQPDDGSGGMASQGRTISASVGRNGVNRHDDVVTIQEMLNIIPAYQGGPVEDLVVDGKSGEKTVSAIMKFQRFVGIGADGRVDPSGATLAALNTVRAMASAERARGKKAGASKKEQMVL